MPWLWLLAMVELVVAGAPLSARRRLGRRRPTLALWAALGAVGRLEQRGAPCQHAAMGLTGNRLKLSPHAQGYRSGAALAARHPPRVFAPVVLLRALDDEHIVGRSQVAGWRVKPQR